MYIGWEKTDWVVGSGAEFRDCWCDALFISFPQIPFKAFMSQNASDLWRADS